MRGITGMNQPILLPQEKYLNSPPDYNIPNNEYYKGKNNWKANDNFKYDIGYWIVGIEDGWIYPTRKLAKWYKQKRFDILK